MRRIALLLLVTLRRISGLLRIALRRWSLAALLCWVPALLRFLWRLVCTLLRRIAALRRHLRLRICIRRL